MRALLIAGPGGHIRELHALRPRFRPSVDDPLWITGDTVQTRSLLAGERACFLESRPRDLGRVLANAVSARRLLRGERFDVMVSTGSSIALSFLPLSDANGVRGHYIESATRVDGPSLTGRLIRRIPGVRCYSQESEWGRGWRCSGSVFDGFHVERRPEEVRPIRRIAVTLGSWSQGFRALVDRMLTIVPPGVEVRWQTGHTRVDDLDLRADPWLTVAAMTHLLRSSDVVVTHGGVGAVLDALEAGRCPVVVPRRREAGEQIDDHQAQLAEMLEHRGLVIARSCLELSFADLLEAGARTVTCPGPPPAFELAD
jgi:UDP-N-acetylglucosamine--N-acetylmuramyl-(pentapeptide) pyrophosphoryl-undecaprenol N-acetylglucosamine transferase